MSTRAGQVPGHERGAVGSERGDREKRKATVFADDRVVFANDPNRSHDMMTPEELAGWTAQQQARHQRTFAPAREARALEDAGCSTCGVPIGSNPHPRPSLRPLLPLNLALRRPVGPGTESRLMTVTPPDGTHAPVARAAFSRTDLATASAGRDSRHEVGGGCTGAAPAEADSDADWLERESALRPIGPVGEDGLGVVATPFCRALGMTAPIVQAPIGSAATPELVAAVSNAGGLGMLALSWTAPGSVRDRIRATRALTDRPFGVNLVLEWDQRERLRACAGEPVAVVSTFWGDPRPYVDAIHASGALHLHTVASAAEARRAVEAGVDAIVAQGWEAGGRVWGEVAALPLVPAVVDAVRPVPVLAAGGVADGRGVAAVLALGADAAWVGTRFLLSHEASVHEQWRRSIQAATETETLYSTLFDRGWPDAPHRTLRNSTARAWERAGRPPAPERPGEGEVIAHAPDGSRLYRYGTDPAVGGTSGDVEALALYAGQSAGLVKHVLPAAAIIDELTGDAARALRQPRR